MDVVQLQTGIITFLILKILIFIFWKSWNLLKHIKVVTFFPNLKDHPLSTSKLSYKTLQSNLMLCSDMS